jgi:hypothetical protein
MASAASSSNGVSTCSAARSGSYCKGDPSPRAPFADSRSWLLACRVGGSVVGTSSVFLIDNRLADVEVATRRCVAPRPDRSPRPARPGGRCQRCGERHRHDDGEPDPEHGQRQVLVDDTQQSVGGASASREFGEQVRFVLVQVREAHPRGAHRSAPQHRGEAAARTPAARDAGRGVRREGRRPRGPASTLRSTPSPTPPTRSTPRRGSPVPLDVVQRRAAAARGARRDRPVPARACCDRCSALSATSPPSSTRGRGGTPRGAGPHPGVRTVRRCTHARSQQTATATAANTVAPTVASKLVATPLGGQPTEQSGPSCAHEHRWGGAQQVAAGTLSQHRGRRINRRAS